MELRAAKRSERRRVVDFLRSEDKHDYVIDWMDQFMDKGRFFFLLDGKRVAGIVHGKLAPDGSAWMSAARVNKDYRGRGWINRMNAYAVGCVPLRHARAARMLIVHDNTSSLRAAEKGGFAVASTMTFLDWEAPKRPRGRAPSGFKPAAPAAFLRAARGSPMLKAQGGLAYMSFNGAFRLDAASARRAKEWLFASEDHGAILAGTFVGGGERWMAIQPMRGGAGVARAVKRFAVEQRADSITVILPATAAARRPFLAEGFTLSPWARRVFILEKRLPKSRPTS